LKKIGNDVGCPNHITFLGDLFVLDDDSFGT